jgi:hypothetical protein
LKQLNQFRLNLILREFYQKKCAIFNRHLDQTILTAILRKSITIFLSLFHKKINIFIGNTAHNYTIDILAMHCCSIKNYNLYFFFVNYYIKSFGF